MVLGNRNKIIVFIMIIGLFFIWFKAKLNLIEIEKSTLVFTSKFSKVENNPRSKYYFFEFFYNNEKKECFVNRAPFGFVNKLGKFYNLKYLNKYPDLIIVNFEKEIIDTTEILKAGFTQDDLPVNQVPAAQSLPKR